MKISGHVFTMTGKCETRCCFPATPTKKDFRVTLRSIRDILVCSRLTVTSENMTSKTVNLRALNFEHHNKNVFLSFIIRKYDTLNAKPLIHIQNMQFWVCMYAWYVFKPTHRWKYNLLKWFFKVSHSWILMKQFSSHNLKCSQQSD